MPLSEEELRALEQMERALVEEDPKFASTLRGTSLRRSARRRAVVAGLVFVVGVAVLMSGAIVQFWPLGVVGFVIMLGAATVGLSAVKGQQAAAAATPGEGGPAATGQAGHPSGLGLIQGGRAGKGRGSRPRNRSQRSSGSFMERMEERWRRRRDDRGGF